MAGRSKRSAGPPCVVVLLLALAAGCASPGKSPLSKAPPSGVPSSPSRPGAQATTTASTAAASTAAASAPTSPATTRPATAAPASTTVAPTAPCGWATTPPAGYQHVVWIWMENHTWPQVLGDRAAAPFEVSLAGQCATGTNDRTVGSPSLPNYIGATSGSTQGITDGGSPTSHPLTADNLFRQVRAAGGTARSYEEDMTQPCQLSPGGNYAVKHNPAAYYLGPSGEDRAACRTDDVPFGSWASDLAAGRLPTFSFITPNLCHDTHDCSVATGDAWLADELPPLLASPVYRDGRTAIVVVWDEDSPVPNIVIGPGVHPGTVVTQPFDHFALLRTSEEMLGLPGRLGAAATAPSLRRPFNL